MSRATKSGFAAEAHKKVDLYRTTDVSVNEQQFYDIIFFQIQDKYNPALATEVLHWINEVSGQNVSTDGGMNEFVATLKDGTVLCKYALKH